ncbi:GGDEF domain-containing protein [Alteromonas confluentis]|uniref:diguanylate cyclase n=1 Tax=Alteromonas confluentis TaxID=1656094 RepID=A0A1E7ZFW8_9ALTE|nr:diguanylate cyclase [Alteromonas confluentis]OFC72354.1 diguanylate cyclase [Alteromonas confluentis]
MYWLVVLGLLLPVSAFDNDDIDAVIEKVRAPSYDCPNDSLFPELEATLNQESLTTTQRNALISAKGQFLICRGDFESALTLLGDLVDQPDIDKASYTYVSAINQIGFIYDAQENPTRCQYYRQARSLSSPEKHSDIYMSSSLGMISYCSEYDDVSERLGKMFSILERFYEDGSPAELAHIHNSIGLLYGGLGQHGLAAEQFLKAHDMGVQFYEGSNKLSMLISAIVSLQSSGQNEEAYRRIQEYAALNATINTPLTNYFYYNSLVYYYRKNRDFENLEKTLPDFKAAVSAVSSSFGTLIYKWHEAEICLHNGNLVCLVDYVQQFKDEKNTIPPRLATNLDYLSFNLAIYLALGDVEKARVANDVFAMEAERKRIKQQDSARVLSAANLYNRIYGLEAEVEAEQQARQRILWALLAVFIITGSLATYFLRRKFLAAKAIDPVTQLLNSEVAISRIGKLSAPDKGRAIGIAVFDISNFREITRYLGPSKTNSVLKAIARTLQNNIRGSDILGRFGTEQFIMCLHNVEESSARPYFERMRTAIAQALEEGDTAGSIKVESTVSIFITNEKITGLHDILDDMATSIGLNHRSQ